MTAPLAALAAAAAFAAGIVNAVAGGGTLITFPTLVALGVPTVAANVTNTVALCPGYFGGSYAQRSDLAVHRRRLPALVIAAMAGGLAGGLLLVHTSEALFRDVVPFLILLACALLAGQDSMRRWLGRADAPGGDRSAPLVAAVFLGAVYGGYFGAGLGIMLLAVLGLTVPDSLNRLNAVKQALTLVINVTAAVLFALSGPVDWPLAGVMAVASLAGGNLGGRIAGRLNPRRLRWVVVAFGVAVAVRFWI